MSSLREIILDTETTGLDPRQGHRIVEIGAIEMVNKVLTGRNFHSYINPERDIPFEAYRIHGISSEFLKDKPLFHKIADDFLEFISNSKLIIHNAPFDIQFLNHELSLLKRAEIKLLELANTIDTLVMARNMFPGAKSNLDALCKRFKVDNSGRQLHGALKDAALLAEVYVELTGGRQSTFKMVDQSIGINNLAINQVKHKTRQTTIVIKPTKEELQKHKDFINKILTPA
ncbi:DNA polymerase III subunit epsilon [Rickettsia oklahomensis]|uniref:DNA polymerase III subunit epsilon n=1 Tax=Rickettsia oklahomensis TaxID=3141789 RepID=A0AAU7C0R5_9RICK